MSRYSKPDIADKAVDFVSGNRVLEIIICGFFFLVFFPIIFPYSFVSFLIDEEIGWKGLLLGFVIWILGSIIWILIIDIDGYLWGLIF